MLTATRVRVTTATLVTTVAWKSTNAARILVRMASALTLSDFTRAHAMPALVARDVTRNWEQQVRTLIQLEPCLQSMFAHQLLAGSSVTN